MTPQELNNKIIEALDIGHLSETDRQQTIEMASVAVYQGVVSEAVEKLTDEQGDAFERLLDGEPTPEAVLQFFQANIPDFDQLVAAEVTNFIQEGKELMAKIG